MPLQGTWRIILLIEVYECACKYYCCFFPGIFFTSRLAFIVKSEVTNFAHSFQLVDHCPKPGPFCDIT